MSSCLDLFRIHFSILCSIGVLPYLLLIFFNLSTYLRLKTIQVKYSSQNLKFRKLTRYKMTTTTFQKEEISEHATASMVHQRSKEIKLSQIGLMIVLVFICCHR